MNNYDDKILTIKENEKKLLEMIKTKIMDENRIFNLDTNNIVDVLAYDDKVLKQYEAVIKAQELIKKYTDMIKNSTSVEEIVEIRKELNKCINKIKRAMKNRGFDDIEINNYCEEVKKYRKCVSDNIRFLKREDKIKEIDSLNSQYDLLSEEDKLRLKKLVKNEIAYGKRNINRLNNEIIVNDISNKENKAANEALEGIHFKNEDTKEKQSINKDLSIKLNESIPKNNNMNLKQYDNLYDYVDNKVNIFDGRYNINNMEEYSKGFIKNLKIFTKNLPIIMHNKGKIKYMIRDYNIFYRQAELVGFCEYTKKNNSIFGNLKKAIKGNVLKNKEEYYAEEHEKCVNWIIDFCEENDLHIRYHKLV